MSKAITGGAHPQAKTVSRAGALAGRKLNLYGLLFASPWILGLLIFYALPLVLSIYYSFTSYSILKPGEWVGLDNYRNLMNDKSFWIGIYNTIYFTVIFVPLSIVIGVGVAVLLNMKIKGMSVYRTIFFLPTLVPHVAIAIIWLWILNPRLGLINLALEWVGIQGPAWLSSVAWSKPALIFMSLWGIGNAIVIYLAGLQDVPQDLYDAAAVDGANASQRIRRITIPMLTPVIFFNLVMGMIHAFQQFTLPYALTGGQGTPGTSMLFYVMYLYNNAFIYLKMGYASAMAWILFIVIMILTCIIFVTSKRWVHYQGK
ncbi:carbohydrate ABC transporter permease [Paenibacillus thalictri]|uniref:Sugar ABC transporter permease n=1 Tax=Paenibacillus thalictri TaxID=2527873 RepID=A0A4Q9DYT3_9BACL|nr:sugar ABC transporter permease [Paenibacillus thalictri]TBL81058.1 sugar ABC transporter permease [Paenibacillus thalictri]